MLQVKLSPADGQALREAARALAASAAEENKHKKAREAAKTLIARELVRLRKISVDELPAGELVLVQVDGGDVLKIERKASQRLDTPALGAAHPQIVEQFTRPCVASYFNCLLPG